MIRSNLILHGSELQFCKMIHNACLYALNDIYDETIEFNTIVNMYIALLVSKINLNAKLCYTANMKTGIVGYAAMLLGYSVYGSYDRKYFRIQTKPYKKINANIFSNLSSSFVLYNNSSLVVYDNRNTLVEEDRQFFNRLRDHTDPETLILPLNVRRVYKFNIPLTKIHVRSSVNLFRLT